MMMQAITIKPTMEITTSSVTAMGTETETGVRPSPPVKCIEWQETLCYFIDIQMNHNRYLLYLLTNLVQSGVQVRVRGQTVVILKWWLLLYIGVKV